MDRQAVLDLHIPTILRGSGNDYGAGDISDMYELIDHCSTAGFSAIQMNPVLDTAMNTSPYMSASSFSFNPIYLAVDKLEKNPDIEKLKKQRLLFVRNREDEGLIDYKELYRFKTQALEAAYKQLASEDKIVPDRFEKHVLDYAVFSAISERTKTKWHHWSKEFRDSCSLDIIEKNPDIAERARFFLYSQAVLAKQWRELFKYGKKKGVGIFSDKPIYPIHNSSDVWGNKNLFYLDSGGGPKYVSGCDNPDDPFGRQIWNQAVFKFRENPDAVIEFFMETIKFQTSFSNGVRLDHAIALVWKYYIVDTKTGKGRHIDAIKEKLLGHLKNKFPDISFVAEDVGFVDEELIDEPLQKFGLPGIRCPQWADKVKYSDIQSYPELCVAISSNHDLPNVRSWWKELGPKEKSIFIKDNSWQTMSVDDCALEIIKKVFYSKARLAGITMRDLAKDDRRFNKPGTISKSNWRNRLKTPTDEVDFTLIKKIIDESNRGQKNGK